MNLIHCNVETQSVSTFRAQTAHVLLKSALLQKKKKKKNSLQQASLLRRQLQQTADCRATAVCCFAANLLAASCLMQTAAN